MKPLADIRILAIEQYGAGPFGSVHLADLGADVIKIEDPRSGGDVGRSVPPFQEDGDSLFFETFNRNKRSIQLDLANPAGREVFEALVAVSDAVFSNLRGDVPAKLHIRHADLAHLNPRIVCGSITGFGMTGPRSDQPGYDYILQGLAGWMSLTGEPDGPPTKSGLSLVDFSGGLVGALSLMCAVHAARRDGVGSDCDVSLHDVALSMLTYPATWHLNGGWEPTRTSRSAHPSMVPFQLFQGADEEWFLVACPKEKFWQRLTSVVGMPELANDERFVDFAARDRNRTELIPILDSAFATADAGEWIDRLERAGVPTGPVLDVPAALRDPQVEERGLLIETDHPRFGRVRQMASPVRVGPLERHHRRAPFLGEHRDDVLTDLLGYDESRIRELADRGAFGRA
ncbi:MAG TPA: CoA transferase [Acidimicrobiia bacterium]|nr:CoA transferase [Acidimicrobiia bacterium]